MKSDAQAANPRVAQITIMNPQTRTIDRTPRAGRTASGLCAAARRRPAR
jgi:hypothetical protein